MKINIIIQLKDDVLDPQGLAIKNALKANHYNNLISLRQGKIIEIEIDETDKEKIMEQAKKMCKDLLVNSTIENYKIHFVEV